MSRRRISSRKEIHSVDIQGDAIATNAASPLVLLNGVANGTSFYQHSGKYVSPLGFEIWGTVENNSTTEAIACRVIIVWDRSSNNSSPNPSSILADYNAAGTVLTNVYAGRNPVYTTKMYTIVDWLCWLPPAPASGEGFRSFNIYKSLKGLTQQFSGTDATVGSITSGSLYMLFICDNAGPTPGVTMHYSARYRYYDN